MNQIINISNSKIKKLKEHKWEITKQIVKALKTAQCCDQVSLIVYCKSSLIHLISGHMLINKPFKIANLIQQSSNPYLSPILAKNIRLKTNYFK